MSELFVSKWPGLVYSGTTITRANGSMQRATNAWIDGEGRLTSRPGYKFTTQLLADSPACAPKNFLDVRAIRSIGQMATGTTLTIEAGTKLVPNFNLAFFMASPTLSQYDTHYAPVAIANAVSPTNPVLVTSMPARTTGYCLDNTDKPEYLPLQRFEGTTNDSILTDRPQVTQFGDFVVSHYDAQHMYGLRSTYPNPDLNQSSYEPSADINAVWKHYGFGVPYALVPRSDSVGVIPTAGGWFADGKRTAYTAVVVFTVNNVEWLGPASVPYVIENTSGSDATTRLRWPIPPQTGTWRLDSSTNIQYQDMQAVLRVYRSVIQTDITAKGHASDYRLIYETPIDSSNTNSFTYVEFDDIVPDAGDYGGLMGEAAYVSENIGEGFAQRNEWPPGAKAVETLNGVTMYGHIWERAQLEISLLNVNTQLVDGTQMILQVQSGTADTNPGTGLPITFTARLAPSSVTEYQLYTTGTTTENTRNTAIALAQCINANIVDLGAFAEPVGNTEGQPLDVGKIFISPCRYGDYFLNFFISGPPVFRPTYSGARFRKNRIYYSKPYEPWAVPSLNFFDVGSAHTIIWAMKASGNAVFCFTDVGIYRIYFDSNGPTVELFDKTVFVDGTDCVSAIGDTLYVLARHQVVAVTEGGVRTISENVRQYIEKYNGNGQAGRYSHVRAWVPQRKVMVVLIEYSTTPGEGDRLNEYFNTRTTLIYDEVSQTWTRTIDRDEEGESENMTIIGACEQDQKVYWFARDAFIEIGLDKNDWYCGECFWEKPYNYDVFGDERLPRGGQFPGEPQSTQVQLGLTQAFTRPAELSLWKEMQLCWFTNSLDVWQLYQPTFSTFYVSALFKTDNFTAGASAAYNATDTNTTRITVPQYAQRASLIQPIINFSADNTNGSLVLQGIKYIVDEISDRNRSQP